MPALVLAAALAAAAPAPACQPAAPQQASAPVRAAPHPLADEPVARRMHAVLRKMGGCLVVDVAAWRDQTQVWEYRLAGPANAAPRPAGQPLVEGAQGFGQ
ncbi:MAG TPA: hypothetical protein VN806_03035 [Caulobacteraceae bacterium]|nr:hypothetical protein [Caulobacteraceae bacterium]